MNKPTLTRADKVQLLKDLQCGRKTIYDLLPSVPMQLHIWDFDKNTEMCTNRKTNEQRTREEIKVMPLSKKQPVLNIIVFRTGRKQINSEKDIE